MDLRKYIFETVAAAILLAGATGCESDDKFLEEKSYTLNTSTFYNSPADIEMALNYGYARIQYMLMGVMHNSCSWLLMGAGLDTFNGTGQNGIGSTNFVQGLTSSDGFVDHWFRNQYYVIYDINKVIQAIEGDTVILHVSDGSAVPRSTPSSRAATPDANVDADQLEQELDAIADELISLFGG